MAGMKMSKIKVFHVLTSGLRKEGIASAQMEFFKRMNRDKFDIIVAAVHDNEEEMINEFRKYGCEVVVFSDRKRETVKYFLELIGYLRKEKPDIIHVHGSSALLSIELVAAKVARIKIRIAHSRNTKADNARSDRFLRLIFNHSYTDALACGEDAGKWLFPKHKFTVVHNGKDFEKFCYSSSLRTQKRIEMDLDGKIVVGHVGRINHQKNHEYLLRVFNEFAKNHENAILYLMGDGPMLDRIKAQVLTFKGLEQKVIFAGGVSNVFERLQAMDIMVFPSKYEGLPNVVLEWQAEGLPCLISDKITTECAVSDLVRFASIEDDPKVWADKMDEMLEQYTDREAQAARGTEALKQNGFDIKDATKQLEDIYTKLVLRN